MATYVVFALKIGEDIKTGIHEVASPAAGNACMRAMDSALSKVFQRERALKERKAAPTEPAEPVATPSDPVSLSDDPLFPGPGPVIDEPAPTEEEKHLLLEWVIVSDERRRAPPGLPGLPGMTPVGSG